MRRLGAVLRVRGQDASQDAPGPRAASPFRRDGRLAQVLPFAVVAIAAEASLALPPGPRSATALAISLALLAAAGCALALPWERLPRPLAVLVPLTYLGSVVALILASGGPGTGVGMVLLVPVVWTALFHQPWESGLVLAALAGAGFVDSYLPGVVGAPVITRRVLFLTALAVMISVATHLLRGRVRRSEAATARLQGRLRELSITADRDRIASSLHETVVQRLVSAGLSLQGVRPLSTDPVVTRRIDAVVANLDGAVRLLRQTIFGLGNVQPAQGLRRGILDMANEVTPALGAVPEVMLDGPLDTALPPEAAAALLAALRDALTRVGSRRRAGRVAVTATAGPDEVCLTVTGADEALVWRLPRQPPPARDAAWEAGPGAA